MSHTKITITPQEVLPMIKEMVAPIAMREGAMYEKAFAIAMDRVINEVSRCHTTGQAVLQLQKLREHFIKVTKESMGMTDEDCMPMAVEYAAYLEQEINSSSSIVGRFYRALDAEARGLPCPCAPCAKDREETRNALENPSSGF